MSRMAINRWSMSATLLVPTTAESMIIRIASVGVALLTMVAWFVDVVPAA